MILLLECRADLDLDAPEVGKPLARSRSAATHNTLIQQFFSPLTVDTGKTNYAAGEFGAVLFAVIVVVATYFWTCRSEVLPLKESADTAVLQPAS